jgi:hypothetical protein
MSATTSAVRALVESLGREHSRNRRTTNAMPKVLQCDTDSGVTPARILPRYPHDQASDLRSHDRTDRSLRGVRPFARDQLAMPAQNRIGCHDRRHLPQQTTAEASPPPRQAAPLLAVKSEFSASEMAPQDAVLLDQIGDDVLLLVIQPAR